MLTSNITWQLAYYSLQYWTTWMLWHQLQRNSNCPSWLSLCSSSHTHTFIIADPANLVQTVAILYSLKCDELLVDGVGRNSICTYKHTHTQYIKYIKTTCSDVPTTNAEISITNVGPVYRPTQYTKECFKFLDFPLADLHKWKCHQFHGQEQP